MLQARDLTVSFDNDLPENIIDSLNFDFKGGDIVWVRGSNGCGKTTLLRCIAGFIKPQSGKIIFSKRDICFIGHSLFIKPYLTALQQFNWFKFLSNRKTIQRDVYVDLLHTLSIDDHDLQMSYMSSGQKQKIQFLYLYFMQSSIILLDEVFSNVDAHSKAIMLKMLKKDFQHSLILYTSHEPLNLNNRELNLAC